MIVMHEADQADGRVIFRLRPREANVRAVAKANLKEPRYTNKECGQSVREDEANICGEETIKSTCRTFRGQRGQHAQKERPGTWETLQ